MSGMNVLQYPSEGISDERGTAPQAAPSWARIAELNSAIIRGHVFCVASLNCQECHANRAVLA